MAKIKKYGTFGGVFTPSILTILGVIMYLRLPWIVGKGGLWMTIGIIVVAHVISFTTGLSVASIATDKKVEAGGSYFMISRSLGLPIGGTLGIALFVGMSFSISLYLIGFSESFLDYWGLEKSITNIRMMGSGSLLLVSIITIISTSLAMKAQYFIMTAIILSLISILFGKADIVPAAPLLNPPPEGALSFSILFSIFFPAVTGFEAGVSMSGDLEDPKKSIPFGTIFAIIVGLVVYIGLAVFFAYKVDPNELANNPGVLQKLTYYLPVLLAGIWGATISSAIGSILGAPRILQATSIDRITPKFFARGYGKTNEPRNALILTIIIAELGILIGELDAIARVVSMFFIAAYSFLNISCAIESLVSPDFRPEFKIPKWVGILGSITCFVIMIQLDLVAMIGAVVIMSLLFLYIKSKELSLEGGDTVGSIWSSVVRQGLFQLTKNKLHERNWRPNMLLFSGGSDSRPYLVEMAKSLAENRGIITNFHLFETEEFNNLSRSQIVAEEVQEFGGVFSRKIECTDIYDEMVQICKYHGFSGMDPNTILLGRARSLTNIKKFSNLIQNLESMDFNVLMFDYDKVNGFGDRSKVDVWWSGHGNNLSFSILLVRFLQSSPKWQNSKFRFCLILNDRTLLETTERKIESILDKYRVRADVFIHYNGLEKKPFYEIIQNKSKDASLTILGLPNYNTEDPIKIGKRIAHFADELKSILWIKANSYFHNVSILPDYSIKKEITEDYNVNLELNKELNPPKELLLFFEDLKKIIEEYYYSYISPIFDNQFNLLEKYKILVNDTYNSLKEKNSYKDIALISQKQAEFFEEAENLIKNYKNEQVNADIETFKKGINVLIENLNNLIIKQPRKIQIFYERELFNNEKRDTFKIRTYKNFKRIFSFNKKIGSKIKFKKMTGLFLRNSLPQEVIEIINLIIKHAYLFINDINSITGNFNEKLKLLQRKIKNEEIKKKVLDLDEKEIIDFIDNSTTSIKIDSYISRALLLKKSLNICDEIAEIISSPFSANEFKSRFKEKKKFKKVYEKIDEVFNSFEKNYSHLLFLAVKGVNLFRLQEDLRNRLNRTIHDPSQKVLKSIINVQDDLNDYLLDLKRKRFKIRDINFTHPELEFSHDSINRNLKKTMDEYFHSLPEELEVISGDSIQLFEEGKQFEASVITIPFRKYIEFSFLTEFQPEIGRNINETQSMIFQNEAFIESYMMELKEKLGLVNVRENKKVLDESIKNLFNFSESSDLKVKNLHQKMEKSFEMILDKINVFYLIKNSRSLGRLTADENIYTSFYKKLLIKFRNLISNLFQNYLISKSKAILLNRKLRKETDSFSKKNHFLEVLEQFKLKEDVAKNLPFFYSNLFLDSILFDREFYVERVKQTEKAKQIFEKSKKGILLVYGEPQSGKSFFCDFIAGEFYPENKIFKLNLSEERCETQGDLYEFISDALKKDVTKTSFKENFPKKSALIIDDLELYWERKNGGNKILKEIFSLKNLIDEDSIIIINLNVFTFKLLWNIENIENYISGSIECGPFQPEEVKDVIWKKHKKTGYKINFLGKKEEYLTDFQISKLFHDIYDKSEGNIGHALKLWMLSIESLNESTLNMKFPPKIEVENLSHLGTMQLCILNQLVFHKALPLKKLAQLIELSVENTDELVENLSKYNLVFIDSQNYILLNPFIQKILLDYLKEKEII